MYLGIEDLDWDTESAYLREFEKEVGMGTDVDYHIQSCRDYRPCVLLGS
jgi:hypothetical protein